MIETIIPAPTAAILPILLPALIGGVATLGATALQNKAAKRNAAAQNAASVTIAADQTAANMELAQFQTQANRELAAEQNKAAREQADRQYQRDMEAMHLQRQWHAEDLKFAAENPTKIVAQVDYEQMAKSAEAAGFNPLTAIRNGGSAGFTGTSQPSTPLSRQAPVYQEPLRQVGARAVGGRAVASRVAPQLDGYGDAFLGIGTMLADAVDPHKRRMRELEINMVEASLANLQSSTALNKVRFGEVPTYTATDRQRQMGSGVAHGQTFRSITDHLPVKAGVSQTPTVERPTVTNPTRTGNRIWHVDPAQPDGAAWGDRYGEPGEWFGGALNAVTDALYNAGRAIGSVQKKFGRDNVGAIGRTPPPPRRSGGGGW